MKTLSLKGKNALVTGGSRGLGSAIVLALAEAGARTAINYLPDPEGQNREQALATAEKAEKAGKTGNEALPVPADIRSAESTTAMMEQIRAAFGGLDIVINNAGILRDRSLKKMHEQEWQDVIDTNLTGLFHVCQSALPLIRDGGRIVNIASIAGIMGFFGQTNYAASKAGVIGFTRSLSRELGRKRITVNVVAPGVVLTEMGTSIPEDIRQAMLKNIPLERFPEPEEVADAVLFLCSDMAACITGQVLQVNGGWIG